MTQARESDVDRVRYWLAENLIALDAITFADIAAYAAAEVASVSALPQREKFEHWQNTFFKANGRWPLVLEGMEWATQQTAREVLSRIMSAAILNDATMKAVNEIREKYGLEEP